MIFSQKILKRKLIHRPFFFPDCVLTIQASLLLFSNKKVTSVLMQGSSSNADGEVRRRKKLENKSPNKREGVLGFHSSNMTSS